MNYHVKIWLVTELRDLFGVSLERQDLAEDLIEITERDLKRPIKDIEARLVLASSGKFPEMEEDLYKRAISAAGEEVKLGILKANREREKNGHWIMNRLVVSRKERE